MNLFAAADGYGRFDGDVAVQMDAALGGFNAFDTWKNDIGGSGRLSKTGSGTLALQGSNSYSGGTLLQAGTLLAETPKALGSGDVFVEAGTLELDSKTGVLVGGNYTQLDAALRVKLGEGKTDPALSVQGTVSLDGARLVLDFAAKPKAGTTVQLIKAAKIQGGFKSVDAGDHKVSLRYTATSVTARIIN